MILKEGLKTCSVCKINKPILEFTKKRASKDGLNHCCKVCSNEKCKQQYEKNRESRLASVKVYQKEHAEEIKAKKAEKYQENIEENRRKKRDEYSKDPDKFKHAVALYAERNPEKIKLSSALYFMNNPDKIRALRLLRRARENEAQGSCTAGQLRWRLEFHGYKCVYCKKGVTDNFHVDHMIPLCRGGTNWPSNLVPACQKCNNSKHAKTYAEFVEKRYQKDKICA